MRGLTLRCRTLILRSLMSMWSLISVSSVFMRLRSCCACIATCVFFSIIRFFSSSRCRISSTCTFPNGATVKRKDRREKPSDESKSGIFNAHYVLRTYTRRNATLVRKKGRRGEEREKKSSTQFSATWRLGLPLFSFSGYARFAVALTWLPESSDRVVKQQSRVTDYLTHSEIPSRRALLKV